MERERRRPSICQICGKEVLGGSWVHKECFEREEQGVGAIYEAYRKAWGEAHPLKFDRVMSEEEAKREIEEEEQKCPLIMDKANRELGEAFKGITEPDNRRKLLEQFFSRHDYEPVRYLIEFAEKNNLQIN